MFRIKLKELRESKGLSQYAFARDFGVSQSAVGNWESGIRLPKADIIEKIAEYFDVSIDYLLGRSDERNPSVQSDRGIEDIKAALFGGDTEVTDEMWEELQEFIKFIKHKNQN